MRMCQLFLVCYYFHSNMAVEHVVIIFGLKVEDAFDSPWIWQNLKVLHLEKRHLEFKKWINSIPVENNISLAMGNIK